MNVNITGSGRVSSPPVDLYMAMAGKLRRSVRTQASVQPDRLASSKMACMRALPIP